jgi:hypothetical protein
MNLYGNFTKLIAMSSFNALPSWGQEHQSPVEENIKKSGLEEGAESKRRRGERQQMFTDAVNEPSLLSWVRTHQSVVKENGPEYKRRRDERRQMHTDTVNEDLGLLVKNREQLADGSVIARNVGGLRDCHLVYKNLRSVFPDDAVNDMIVFAGEHPKNPNPMNKKTYLQRTQFAYTREGDEYTFGQNNPTYNFENIETNDRLRLVRLCIEQAAAAVHNINEPYLGGGRTLEAIKQAVVCAQINLYPGGSQLGYHQDNERYHSAGSPIVGFTFYNDKFRDGTVTRQFVVSSDKAGSKPVARVATKHGDMIIMCGEDFQKKLWHSIPKVNSKALEGMLRLSVTVRFNFDKAPSQFAVSTVKNSSPADNIVEASDKDGNSDMDPIEVSDSDSEDGEVLVVSSDSDSDSDMVTPNLVEATKGL